MDLFPLLPRTLLALSFISLATLPVLALQASLPPTSFNNPFRVIAVIHRAQQPELPLCCLTPPPTTDSSEGPEGVLLSFEEWKSKQSHAGLQSAPAKSGVDMSDSDTPSKTNVQNGDVPPIDAQLPPNLSYYTSEDALPPHFRVPITDRFNYADMDCSARVHTAHESAKSASSILSSKKDKYMLLPCSADVQFVVVELCDDIRIDTVQLANFEFFSGVFKDFSVSVAKTFTGTDEGWTPAGSYRAKNVRGVQSFHLPTSLRDFYRYIRIDFHSHYGHEYYCPVSLLRVYGLTHLEEWKWDTWLLESHARLKDSAAQRSLFGEHPSASNVMDLKVESNNSTHVSTTQLATTEARSNLTSQPSPVQAASTPTRETPSSPSSPSTSSESWRRTSPHVLGDETWISSSGDGEQQTLETQSTGVRSITEAISSLLSMPSPASVLPTPPAAEHPHSHDTEIHTFTPLSSQPSNPPILPLVQQIPTHAPSPPQWSGESIYRTIMNRLAILEANHTLYVRYVEEQTASVREVLRKLNEEVGRLESISRMQAQMYQRTVHEWERQRLRLELEHGELLSRVNYLSDEVVLEKRLGIAQLCLLLAVLVFIGLTRGAPSAQHHPSTVHGSTREGGVRSLSIGSSADGWNPFGGRSRSPSERGSTKAEKSTAIDKLFPELMGSSVSKPELLATTQSPQHVARVFKFTVTSTAASSHKRVHTSSAFRTPTKPRPLMLIDPHTLPRAESITRSHSSSTSGHPHVRSAKRWARTAHLHEIKVFRERHGSGVGKRSGAHKDRENDHEDVFNVLPSLSPSHAKNRPQDVLRRPLTPFGAVRSSEESTDADAWIDTDVDVEDDVSVA
ncbi:UNC-like C-terminal-domain-containing protein [Butyriboletus roseoflavus]|nr:UNC-like C-terminal-domain-containing protein [Butyriboletus roseoflavus]